MKVYYHSFLYDTELTSGSVFRAIPCKAFLELYREKNESPCEILYNGLLIQSDKVEINWNEENELVIRQNGERFVYKVQPLVQPLSMKYAETYEQFIYEYRNAENDEIRSIQQGSLRLYAVDQNIEVHDYTEIFDQIERAFPSFKSICERPKSHLKAVNEVRPIETVKRIGYESIPYLAAHSEDWLARTASGLKPARLFSRVEDDEFEIYENRVVKTLIDLIIGFLRKTEKQLRDQHDQLRGIMNSSVQTGSFGFDVNFQKAVNELMSSDNKGEEYRSKSLELTGKLQSKAYNLLKRYRTLRETKLYKYLKKSRPVSNPLKETNILLLDKNYSVIFKLWKKIHHEIAPKMIEKENQIAFNDVSDDFQQFCATLCGYAAHVLDFKFLEKGHYKRKTDHIDLMIECLESGAVKVSLKDVEPRRKEVPSNISVPISAGTSSEYGISYDGEYLSWFNDITEEDIDSFCSLFKTKNSRGKEQNEERRRYFELKSFLEEANRSYGKPKKTEFLILPMPVELGAENLTSFKFLIEEAADRYRAEKPGIELILALPVCNESEQKITQYAKEEGQVISIIPLTMFDINSFRRLQNMLYRQILKLEKDSCPNCGGVLRERDNQHICNNCNQLTLTRTVCPNPVCRHEYLYMSYDVPETTLQKMQEIDKDSFFEWDSLYQYKDIVNMTVSSGKIRAICPWCHQS